MIAACTSPSAPSAFTTTQRCGAPRAISRNPAFTRAMEERVQPLVAIRVHAALELPLDRHRLRHVQHDGQLRMDAHQPRQRRDHAAIRPQPIALVGHRRVVEPVAHHPHPGLQRRADGLLHMLRPAAKCSSVSAGARPLDAAARAAARAAPPPPARRPARACAAPARRAPSAPRPAACAWVDLPAPSPPSSVMKALGPMRQPREPRAALARARLARASAAPGDRCDAPHYPPVT